jgi:hypothetical protein
MAYPYGNKIRAVIKRRLQQKMESGINPHNKKRPPIERRPHIGKLIVL